MAGEFALLHVGRLVVSPIAYLVYPQWLIEYRSWPEFVCRLGMDKPEGILFRCNVFHRHKNFHYFKVPRVDLQQENQQTFWLTYLYRVGLSRPARSIVSFLVIRIRTS